MKNKMIIANISFLSWVIHLINVLLNIVIIIAIKKECMSTVKN
ncbi:hypothetical protein NitYY0814_C0981 [Nitratiruptor sp. YY08-14]|nr:hypothetical protein NitYY0810_C1140 [Nitratiruptor sp. YY08-10]BCD64136.1 hypothetical protein NitYY0814_C0981 [Nitratiruptor sp. YY08-14]